MSQTKRGSFIEAVVNVLVGFGINFFCNLWILPMFGFNITPSVAFNIGLIFTVVSIARSYVLRRVFNKVKTKWNTASASDIPSDYEKCRMKRYG